MMLPNVFRNSKFDVMQKFLATNLYGWYISFLQRHSLTAKKFALLATIKGRYGKNFGNHNFALSKINFFSNEQKVIAKKIFATINFTL